MRAVVQRLVRSPCIIGPCRRRLTRRRRCVRSNFSGRPGEKRTRNALAPPLRRASRQRITELGLQPMRRPTSLRDSPASSNASARLRRSSSRSALPFSLGIGVPQHLLYCILYAEINSCGRRRSYFAGGWQLQHRDDNENWSSVLIWKVSRLALERTYETVARI